jgi:delta-1-pyrroline-5-carboxylate synthetase
MSLYETMFSQFNVTTSQLLLTAFDFTSPERRRNVQYVISQLLSLGIVPLLNENDAVSANQGYKLFGNTFSDNDSLAALVSIEMNANLLILLTDVKGVYDRPPTDATAKLIDVYDYDKSITIGDKSLQGRGGMGAKVDAAIRAIDGGIHAVVIADGSCIGIIAEILRGDKVGTLFLARSVANGAHDKGGKSESIDCNFKDDTDAVTLAELARIGSRNLQKLKNHERSQILTEIANQLLAQKSEILAVNELDVKDAEISGIPSSNLKRLKLTAEKLATLADGINSIAQSEEPIGKLLSRLELSENLVLDKVTAPIGLLD